MVDKKGSLEGFMRDREYVASLKLNKQLVNIGLDDNGQCYFVEYVDPKTNEDKRVSLGTYNSDYEYAAQELLGEPTIDCPYYNLTLLFHNLYDQNPYQRYHQYLLYPFFQISNAESGKEC